MIGSLKERYLPIYLNNIREGLADSTVWNKRHHADMFLDYLEGAGFRDLSGLACSDVYGYINSLHFASQTISGIEFSLREFLDILYSQGLTAIDGRTAFPVIHTNKRDRILSCYAATEVRDIVSAIDLNGKNGMRNRCMVGMAAQMGMRRSDIVNLRISDIKWDRSVIEKHQEKTGFIVTVPMPKDIKLLLIDYMKNHRPESDSEYVFIRPETGNRYCASIVYAIMNQGLLKKAGVVPGNRKHGPHALRHSLATLLIK